MVDQVLFFIYFQEASQVNFREIAGQTAYPFDTPVRLMQFHPGFIFRHAGKFGVRVVPEFSQPLVSDLNRQQIAFMFGPDQFVPVPVEFTLSMPSPPNAM